MTELINTTLNINGREAKIATDPHCTLLEALREHLALTGTKYGCGEGACGACAVLVDGKLTLSCSTQLSEVVGKSITTVEGLATEGSLHPVQQAFLDAEAFQCGFCTPGMIVATVDLLRRQPTPSEEEIREAMNGQLCRCCGYVRIVDAVKRAAEASARK